MGYKALTEVEPMESREMPTADNVKTEEPTEGDRAHLEIAVDASSSASEKVEPDLFEASSQNNPTSGGLSGWRAVILGLGIGVALTVSGMRVMADRPATKAPVAVPPTDSPPKIGQTVTAAPVLTANVERTLEATGTVAAYDLLPVLPQATGLQVQQVLVDEGDYVEAGQVMAILDDAVLRSQIDQASAQVESSRSAVDQKQAAIDQAKGSLAQALSSVAEAEAAVSQTRASQTEAEAAVSVARAALAEAEAGREQALANKERAQSNIAQAQRELERYQTLADAGAIGLQELEVYRTKADNAVEEVRVATATISGAEAKIKSAIANVSSAQARVKSAIANVSSAEARLSNARANVGNAKAQIESAIANVSSARADVKSDEAKVEQQQTQKEQTLVRSPKSGIVAERIARVGDVTGGGQKLFSIIRDGQLELQAKVPETQLSQVKIGATAIVTSDADSRIQLEGTVREIAPLVDAASRQATVKIDLPSGDLLRPGMFLRVAITASQNQSLTVPAKAILPQGDGKAIVYVVQAENKVKAQPVEVGEIVGGSGEDLVNAQVEIKSGLQLGDRVVVAGAGYVKDGDYVKIVPDSNLK